MQSTDSEQMTIGELATRAGLPVKTIRFYSDSGLLPPTARTEAGYRLYGAEALVRLDLIRTLRDAGLDLATIESVLAHEMSLRDALSLRLHAIEAHVVSLKNVGAAIRAALKTEPDENDLRRLHAVTRLSNEERRAVIERFFEQVTEGTLVDDDWTRQMIEGSRPDLPDDPSAEQLDAWIELAEIVSAPDFIESMRNMAQDWTEDFDHQAYMQGSNELVGVASEALARGESPASESGADVARRLVEVIASSSKRTVDAEMRAEVLQRFRDHDPRASRYWELIAIIKGQPAMSGPIEEWNWIAEAVTIHLA